MSFHFEQLESRLLLAASIKHKGKNLIINGSDDAETIRIVGTGTVGEVQVDLNGDGDLADEGEATVYTGVKNIKVNGKGGNDSVTVENVNIEGNLSFKGGKGDDSGSIIGSTIGGKVTVNGQQGNDAWEDLGGNTYNPKKAPNVKAEANTVTPPGPLSLVNDTYSTADNIEVWDWVTDNDELGEAFGGITSVAGNSQTDSEYNADGQLNLTLAYGNLVMWSNGEFEYTPTADVPAGTTVTDTFTYTYTDIEGNTATANVSISISGDPVREAADDTYDIAEGDFGAPGAFNVLTNDLPHPGGVGTVVGLRSYGWGSLYVTNPVIAAGATVTLYTKAAIGNLAANAAVGTLSVAANGTVTFVADAALDANALANGEDLNIELEYQLSTTLGDNTAYLNITLQGA